MKTKGCFNCDGVMYLGVGGWICLACDTFDAQGAAAELAISAFDVYKKARAGLLKEIKRACNMENPEKIIIELSNRLEQLQQKRDADLARLNELETLTRRAAERETKKQKSAL